MFQHFILFRNDLDIQQTSIIWFNLAKLLTVEVTKEISVTIFKLAYHKTIIVKKYSPKNLYPTCIYLFVFNN